MIAECLSPVVVFKIILFGYFWSFFLVSSVNVIIGNTAQIYCFHPEEVAADNNLYIIVEFLPAKEDNSKYRKIVKYKPSDGRDEWFDSSYESRFDFINSGWLKIDLVGMPDEGTFRCSSRSFLLIEDVVEVTPITVYIPPVVEVTKVTDPLQMGTSPVRALKCAAKGGELVCGCQLLCAKMSPKLGLPCKPSTLVKGKPPAQVTWSGDRFADFTQLRTNETSTTLTTVTTVLQVVPYKSLNKQVFLCEVRHPAFERNNETLIALNVTYPPDLPKILVDDSRKLLTCKSDGNPPPVYEWKMPTGIDPPKVYGPTVKIIKPHDPQRQDDIYVCIADNSIAEPQTTNITTYQAVNSAPDVSQGNLALIIGVSAGGVVLVVVLIFICRKRKKKSSFKNGEVCTKSVRAQHPDTERYYQRVLKPPSVCEQPPPNRTWTTPREEYYDEGSRYSGAYSYDSFADDVDLDDAPIATDDEVSLDVGSKPGASSKSSVNFKKHGSYQSSLANSQRSVEKYSYPSQSYSNHVNRAPAQYHYDTVPAALQSHYDRPRKPPIPHYNQLSEEYATLDHSSNDLGFQNTTRYENVRTGKPFMM